ncbi:hypothetical protein A5893_03505 [Pedobacter psychrophilus]|uniref:Beta-lactamase-inhibitor-like PepSY-like domain-containing protein n=1 Tax=Pedobacter psychrophilus TaxID=1826909 RepID=A0A179DNU3_9SPHI|nr:hypothetical protein [Pedobacter psychrophilus]OAQ42193.1 hypothetical protein A5893_03505 [Pedobacter psychrophilus]
MKKLFISSIFVFLSATMVVNASVKNLKTDDDKEKISTPVLQQFGYTFYNAKNVSWTFNEKFQKATFYLDGKKTFAIYDLDNNFLVATQLSAINDLPEIAKKDLAKNYSDYTINNILKVVSRSLNYSSDDDTNSYWIDLSNNETYKVAVVFPNSSLNILKSEKIK